MLKKSGILGVPLTAARVSTGVIVLVRALLRRAL
jgi:hypothetical protein